MQGGQDTEEPGGQALGAAGKPPPTGNLGKSICASLLRSFPEVVFLTALGPRVAQFNRSVRESIGFGGAGLRGPRSLV